MISARILPQEEWPRLAGTEAEKLWPMLNPENARVWVVEKDGKIVATWTLLRVVHAECIWVAPEVRGEFGVVKRLLKGKSEIATAWGADRVVTGSVSPDVTELIMRFGGELMPCETFILPVNGIGLGRKRDREIGREFHRQLSALVPEDIHPEDAQHDERVGKALRTAIREGDPLRAMDEYNAWARGAGYEPIRYLGMVNGRVRADIKTALIEIDDQYAVSVVEELCRS